MKNEKKQDQLQDALGKIDEKLVARAARQPMKFATKIKWISSSTGRRFPWAATRWCIFPWAPTTA